MSGPSPADLKRYLSGDVNIMREVMGELLAANWPQQAGFMHVREYAIPLGMGQSPDESYARIRDEDTRRFTDLAIKAFALEAKRNNKTLTAEQTETDRAQWSKFYQDEFIPQHPEAPDNGPQKRLGGQMVVKKYGVTSDMIFSYEDDAGKPHDFKIGVVNINGSGCTHCKSAQEARKSIPGVCAVTSPEAVMQDRLKYLDTSMHEMAHALRMLQGKLQDETPDGERREEGIARVFAGLMLAKLTGPLGVAALERQIADPIYDNYKYEATGPMRAALELARDPQKMAALSPAQLLDKAEQLVVQHDPTLRMTAEQRQGYKTFIELADNSSSDNIRRRQQRVGDVQGPTAAFTDLTDPMRAAQNQITITYSYMPAMRAFENERLMRVDNMDGWRREQQKLNPFATDALKGLLQYEQPKDARAREELIEFSREFNHSDCTPEEILPSASSAPKTAAKAPPKRPKVQ